MTVQPKKVELIELFYDLIYVYAISRMTMLVETPTNGGIPLYNLFHYLVISFVILQGWLYMTNYINRYGQWRWYEYGLSAVNMMAAVYMANTISIRWNAMAPAFNASVLVMLLCVSAMYYIQIRIKKKDIGAAENSLFILCIDCFLYFAAYLCSILLNERIVIWIDSIAVLVGAFLPFFIRGNFNKKIINFPHLMERFELITIITFGEGIVGMTEYFNVSHFSLKPLFVFMTLLLLFGCYVIQIHHLCNHNRTERALKLMFNHYFIVIAVNLITVAFKLLENPTTHLRFVSIWMLCGLTLFFISLYANSGYYYPAYTFTRMDMLLCLVFLSISGIIMITGSSYLYAILIGTLAGVIGNFVLLFRKYKQHN